MSGPLTIHTPLILRFVPMRVRTNETDRIVYSSSCASFIRLPTRLRHSARLKNAYVSEKKM